MEAEWFYVVDGERNGPVTLDELIELVRAGRVGREHLVWHPPFGPEWKAARDVAELAQAFAAAPAVPNLPPLFEAAPAPDAVADIEPPAFWGVKGRSPSAFFAGRNAWRKMVNTLFRGFSFARWCSIGFCVWLASLGNGGGGSSPHFPTNSNGQHAQMPQQVGELVANAKAEFDHALLWVSNNFFTPKYLAIAAGVLLFMFLFMMVFMSLSARGEFMFLHRLYAPDETIKEGWKKAKENGHRLFVWKVCFALCLFAVGAINSALIWKWLAVPYMRSGMVWTVEFMLFPALALAMLFLLLIMTVGGINELLRDFVLPVMYWQNVSVRTAWRSAFSLCNQHPFGIIGFYLVKGLFTSGFIMAYLLMIIGTLFIGAIVLAMPFIGTVAFLPLTYFLRAYSVDYVSQWRDDLVPRK